MSLKTLVKKYLPENVCEKIMNYNSEKKFKNLKREIKEIRKNKKIIFLMATPNHGNVGDQAIALAERNFLEVELKEFQVIEIMYNEYVRWKEKLSELVMDNDILCYHGGGNMGTQYFECETVFRDIITRFANNKIISFPQTIFYEKDEFGRQEFEKSKEIYGKHSGLVLVAREKFSYEVMKEAYGMTNTVILVPDIVLYLQPEKSVTKKGALVCLRNDVERSLSEEQHAYIFRILRKYFDSVIQSDTVVNVDYVSKEQRNDIVMNKIDEFRKAELVVTDRLHGMVFSYLAGTPCLVMQNYNYKVAGVYEWLKKSNKIVFMDDIEMFEDCYNNLVNDNEEVVVDKKLFNELKKLFVE